MIKNLLPYIFIVCCGLCFSRAYAQAPDNSIELSPSYGLQIVSIDKYKMRGNFYGTDLAFHLNMANDRADWVQMLHITDITFAASYHQLDRLYLVSNPGSQGILGNSFGAVARLGVNLGGAGKTKLMFYPGFGLAYLTQSFQTSGDPFNGSNLNYSITAGLKLVTRVTAQTSLSYGFDVYHFSNGALRLPNEGLNILNATFGIDQNIGGQGPVTNNHPFINASKSRFELGINLGRRGLVQSGAGLTGDVAANQRSGTSHLYNTGVSASYSYNINPVLSLKLVSDAVYSYTKFDYNNFYATFQERATSLDQLRVGAGLGVDVWLGRVAIEGSYSHYIHFDSYYPEQWYWTAGAKYYFTHWLAAEGKVYMQGTESESTGYGLLFRVK